MGRNIFEGWHLIVLLVVILLLFGARRLPDLARGLGQSLKIFKSEVTDLRKDDPKQADVPVPPVAPSPDAPVVPPVAGPVVPQDPASPESPVQPGTGTPGTTPKI